MSNISIGWNEASPANTDLVGQGDDEIRSFKSNVRGGLAAEHDWPSSSGNAGAHKLGSARVFVGPTSQVSSADTSGRLMWNSTVSSLNYVGSEGSAFIGGLLTPSFSPTGTLTLSAGSRFVAEFGEVTQATWPTGPLSLNMPSSLLTPKVVLSVVNPATNTVTSGTSQYAVAYWNAAVPLGGTLRLMVFNGDGSTSTHTTTVQYLVLGYGPL